MAEREKSALYPGVTWNDCVEFIKRIAAFNLKAVSYRALAEKYGLSSVTTKSFTTRIGAAKQFGLITTSQETIQLTDLSKKILYPTDASIREVELECFALPPLYAKLISKYDGLALPSNEILANILMSEHRITRAVKDTAAKCFLESADQLALVKGGILCYSEARENREQSVPKEDRVEPVEESVLVQQGQVLTQCVPHAGISRTAEEADFITQSIPFESGRVARFSIPIDATEDDLLLLRDMFDVLLRRKFKLDI